MTPGPDDAATPPRQERTLSDLFGDLAREASQLLRFEISLAKAEFGDKLGRVGAGSVAMLAAGLLIHAGVLVLLAAAILALTLVVPGWAAALIVGFGAIAIGLSLVLIGRHYLRVRRLALDRTLRSLREDAEWAREQMR